MRLTLLEDARKRPDLFVWRGAIDPVRLDAWLLSRRLKVPRDLRFFWVQTGGGDFFEGETVLGPPSVTPARQMMSTRVTPITIAGGCRMSILSFTEELVE